MLWYALGVLTVSRLNWTYAKMMKWISALNVVCTYCMHHKYIHTYTIHIHMYVLQICVYLICHVYRLLLLYIRGKLQYKHTNKRDTNQTECERVHFSILATDRSYLHCMLSISLSIRYFRSFYSVWQHVCRRLSRPCRPRRRRCCCLFLLCTHTFSQRNISLLHSLNYGQSFWNFYVYIMLSIYICFWFLFVSRKRTIRFHLYAVLPVYSVFSNMVFVP